MSTVKEQMRLIRTATDSLKDRLPASPDLAIVLGSGLGGLVENMRIVAEIPYSEIIGFPVSTVEGHAGRMLMGELSGKRILCMSGRFHYYEGYTMQQVTLPIRVMHQLGIRRLILTNAAGGVNPEFVPGDLMMITDHINLMPNPLLGANLEEFGPRFPSMHQAYTPKLQKVARSCAEKLMISLKEGVYVGNTGPTFETPHEYNFYRIIGGDAVGMSTVPEAIVAAHSGLELLAFSLISNVGGIDHQVEVSHEEVQEMGREAGVRLQRLLQEIIAAL